jgi:Uma2 family endonuclease
METVASAPTGLPFGRPLTVEDLETMPEDGHRYELLDGTLLVTPAPGWSHQSVQMALAELLRRACPRELRVVAAPFEWRLGRRTALQPDVLVARYAALAAVPQGKYLAEPPLLAVEVLSPSTRRIDLLAKRSAYEDAGVASYWLVDPDPGEPSLTALDLEAGRYVERAMIRGRDTWRAAWPFLVDIRPDDLVTDLRP